jgi:hypothetical protein
LHPSSYFIKVLGLKSLKYAEHDANTEEVRMQNLLGNLKRRDHSRDLEDEINLRY